MIETILNQGYQLEEELGRGSIGVVYRAHDLLLDRDVLVKLLNQARLDEAGRDRLLREARATARLDHPNIISVYDTGESDGVPFIVMQYFAGKSLHEVEKLPITRVLEITIQVCRALENAHSQGIIHRDIKPENVIVVQEGEHWIARLTDFGLARSMASRLTAEGISPPDKMARLLGYIDTVIDNILGGYAALSEKGKARYDMVKTALQTSLDPLTFQASLVAGRKLSIEQVQAEARLMAREVSEAGKP